MFMHMCMYMWTHTLIFIQFLVYINYITVLGPASSISTTDKLRVVFFLCLI